MVFVRCVRVSFVCMLSAATSLGACAESMGARPRHDGGCAGQGVTSGASAEDGDCDGVPTDVDCDDQDPAVGAASEDADCDGVSTNEDCDDQGAASEDADCDGVPTNDDCNDRDPALGAASEDADCDGVSTMEDCDDNDPGFGASAHDVDCDGATTVEDCDDIDPALGDSANDADCDGVLIRDDCDDSDPAVGASTDDVDCDGALAMVDCDDNDPALGASAQDADCDGVSTRDDCDDADVAIGVLDAESQCYKFPISYVGASLANTDIASGGDDSLWSSGDDGTTGGTIVEGEHAKDDKWRFRLWEPTSGETGFWEAYFGNNEPEDCVEIVSSVSGLENGNYYVFVFFYAVDWNGPYPIRAGLMSNPGSNQIFSRSSLGMVAGKNALKDLEFVNPPDFYTADRTIRYGYVGEVTVTDGRLSLYIDDLPATRAQDRTWYLGFGFGRVVP